MPLATGGCPPEYPISPKLFTLYQKLGWSGGSDWQSSPTGLQRDGSWDLVPNGWHLFLEPNKRGQVSSTLQHVPLNTMRSPPCRESTKHLECYRGGAQSPNRPFFMCHCDTTLHGCCEDYKKSIHMKCFGLFNRLSKGLKNRVSKGFSLGMLFFFRQKAKVSVHGACWRAEVTSLNR